MVKKIFPKLAHSTLLIVVNILAFPLALILTGMRWLFGISFVRVRSSRIGPLAGTELFLRRIRLGIIKGKETNYIGIATKKVVNEQLMRMLQRKMKILRLPQPKIVRISTQLLANRSLLSKLGLFKELKFQGNEYFELNNTSPLLSFTKEEEEKGRIILHQLGVHDNWFICFHARDSTYADAYLGKRDSTYDFRNGDINKCLPAAEYIALEGGFSLRMGAKVGKNLPEKSNEKIIDYAARYRTEFGDVYLLSKCKFFLGNTAGIGSLCYIFNVPFAFANLIPLTRCPPPGKHDLFISKKIWWVRERRFLTFLEMIESPIILSWQSRQFREEDGLVPVENTAEEILDLAIEMNERLNGTWKTTPEDEELQQQFKELFRSDSHSYGFPSRIGTNFLRENKDLLRTG